MDEPTYRKLDLTMLGLEEGADPGEVSGQINRATRALEVLGLYPPDPGIVQAAKLIRDRIDANRQRGGFGAAPAVYALLARQFDALGAALTDELIADIGMDELDRVRMTALLEDRFDVQISEEVATELGTVGDVIQLVNDLCEFTPITDLEAHE